MRSPKFLTPNGPNGPHRCGWVALVGPPNAGKSTLLNALLGQKISIVTSKPQTTRTRVVGILTDPQSQLIFMDTPGLHTNKSFNKGQLGKMMLQAAWQSLAAADIVVLVLDADLYIRKPEFFERDITPIRDALIQDSRPLIITLNKVDLFHDKSKLLPFLEQVQAIFPRAELYPLSALQKDGLPALRELMVSALPEAPSQFPEDQVSTVPVRFLSAEIVREKVFEHLRQEVPYGTTVDIEAWQEDAERKQTVIHAVIYVSRQSHKSMVIGKNGATIKEIGTFARKDIQELIGNKVHLELWVKVKENWQEDPYLLHDLGLGLD